MEVILVINHTWVRIGSEHNIYRKVYHSSRLSATGFECQFGGWLENNTRCTVTRTVSYGTIRSKPASCQVSTVDFLSMRSSSKQRRSGHIARYCKLLLKLELHTYRHTPSTLYFENKFEIISRMMAGLEV